jgi:hypothetical protein
MGPFETPPNNNLVREEEIEQGEGDSFGVDDDRDRYKDNFPPITKSYWV